MKRFIIFFTTIILITSISLTAFAYEPTQEDFNKTYSFSYYTQAQNGSYNIVKGSVRGAIPVIIMNKMSDGYWNYRLMWLKNNQLTASTSGVNVDVYIWNSTTLNVANPPGNASHLYSSTSVYDSLNYFGVTCNNIACWTTSSTYDTIMSLNDKPIFGSISYFYNGNYYDKVGSYTNDIYYPSVSAWSVANGTSTYVYSKVNFTLSGTSQYDSNAYSYELWSDRNDERKLIAMGTLDSIRKSDTEYQAFNFVYGDSGIFTMSDFQDDFDDMKTIRLLLRLSVAGTSGRTLVSSYSYIDVPVYNLTHSINNGLWSPDVFYGEIKQANNNSFSSDNTDVITGDNLTLKPNNGINFGNTYNVTDFNIQDFTNSANGLRNLVSGISAILVYVPTPFWTVLLMGLAGFITIALIKGLTG